MAAAASAVTAWSSRSRSDPERIQKASVSMLARIFIPEDASSAVAAASRFSEDAGLDVTSQAAASEGSMARATSREG